MKPQTSLAALRSLCLQGLAAETLVPAVLEGLHTLVPSHRNLFDWTNSEGELQHYWIEGPIDVGLARLYFDEFHNQREAEVMLPFQALRHQPAGVRGPGDLHPTGFYKSALYHEIWRPQGFHTRLEAVLRGRQGLLLGSLVLYRGPDDPPFLASDAQRLNSLLPALAQGLEAGADAVASGAAGRRFICSPEPAETLLLTLAGEICHASPGAWGWLLAADGGASQGRLAEGRPGNSLIRQVLAELTGPPGRPARPAAEVVVVRDAAAGRFELRARALTPWDGALGRPARPVALHAAGLHQPLIQVSMRRHEPHTVALERALRALPITAGQMAVCRALYQGLPQARLGSSLGVAQSTVVDHVRKAYLSLGLHSTQDLRSLLDGRIAEAAGP